MSKREASPIELRAEVKRLTQNTDWESGEIILDVFETIPCTHKKIQLDENTGEAAYKLCL
ncbi:MAG: hypothetical protein RR582_09870 [Niameybacter sp.]